MSLVRVGADWPLIGRPEVDELVSAIVSGVADRGIVLAGDAGVGKTRLRAEIVSRVRASGLHVLEISATEASSVAPLGAFSRHLRLPENPSPSASELLRAAHRSLKMASSSGRVFLSVDDAHLLDPLGAHLLHQFALEDSGACLATLRSGEEAPDAVTALWKDDLCRRREVKALLDDDVGALIGKSFDGRVEDRLRTELSEIARGNPLYLRELILGAVETDAVTKQDGAWALRGPLARSVRLRDLVAARLGGLDEPQARVAQVLAIAEPFGLADLESVTGPPALESLFARGVLQLVDDDRRDSVRFSHPLIAEVLRDGMAPQARRRASRWISERLIEHGLRRQGDLLNAAALQIAGKGPCDHRLLTKAALEAASFYDGPETTRLAGAALSAGGDFESQIAYCRGLELDGNEEAARTRLKELLNGAELPADVLRAGAALARLNAFSRSGINRNPSDLYDELRAQIPEDLHPIADAHEAEIWLWAGRVREAGIRAERALARGIPDPNAEGAAFAAACIASSHSVDPTFALTRGAEGAQRAADAGLPGRAGQIAMAVPWSHMSIAQAETALGLQESLRASLPAGPQSDLVLPLFQNAQGWLLLHQGRVAEAQQALESAVESLRAGGDYYGILRASLSLRAQASALQGDAEGLVGRLPDEYAGCPGPEITFAGEMHRALSLGAFARGDTGEGLRESRAAVEVSGDAGLHLVETFSLYDRIRNGRPEEATGALSALAVNAHPEWLGRLFLEHGLALIDENPDRLQALSLRFRKLSFPLYAAEAAATAAALIALSEPRRAFKLERLSEADSRLAGTRSTRALANTPRILSAREGEVAMLAAAGKSSKMIAEALVLSVRTIENHAYRARKKLKMSGDEDFASVIEQGDL